MINLPLSDETIQSLSRHELNVLKYVYEHTESVLDLSIRELSERVSYSPATVLRFCKKLGYSGFAEFKYALRAARRESGGQEAAPSTRPARSSDLMIDLLNSNIQATAGLIQEEQLLRTFREGGVGSVLEGQLIPICAYVTMALALNLVVGISGELSLGHAGFMSIGAFAGASAAAALQGTVESAPCAWPWPCCWAPCSPGSSAS